ncbi:hypothetical protein [Herbiconiux sp. VKM Ac-2851]|uniref:hypothetical protein n=1 Tax=Herbiconiux sp. VKM Ac-2851 TaxID=2739025 RepID=UPI00156405D4|nr:hypothetical protein [Herbiconiux sp. VKM Ac-2851]NQX34760.1 hypothetical protein [Herbiconiux sp. VKM Ac-2851]
MPRTTTVSLDRAGARARLKEAHLYLSAAELLDSGGAAENKVAGSNAIMAGIAAADAICGLVLGERSSGDDHSQAIGLIRKATHPSTKAANSLKRLLTQKTPVQYGADAISASEAADLIRWARDIVLEADEKDRF